MELVHRPALGENWCRARLSQAGRPDTVQGSLWWPCGGKAGHQKGSSGCLCHTLEAAGCGPSPGAQGSVWTYGLFLRQSFRDPRLASKFLCS